MTWHSYFWDTHR